MMSRNFASGVSTVPSSNHRDRTGNSFDGMGGMDHSIIAVRSRGRIRKRDAVAAKREVGIHALYSRRRSTESLFNSPLNGEGSHRTEFGKSIGFLQNVT